jgi:hypothetical protein
MKKFFMVVSLRTPVVLNLRRFFWRRFSFQREIVTRDSKAETPVQHVLEALYLQRYCQASRLETYPY